MRKLGRAVCGATLVVYCSGCSFIFVSGPSRSSDAAVGGGTERINCTSSPVAPILDTVFATLEAGRTVAALAASDRDYEGAPISRNADIGFGIGFTALFLSSAVYGFTKTTKCRRLLHPKVDRAWPEGRSDAVAALDVSVPLRLRRPRVGAPTLAALGSGVLDREVVSSETEDCAATPRFGLTW